MIPLQRTRLQARPLNEPRPCFICLKPTNPVNNKNLIKNGTNSFYYITVICGYLKIVSAPKSTEDFRTICDDCYPTLESFSEVYKEWIRLECKLNQNINQIGKLIKVQHQDGNERGVGTGHISNTSSSEFRKTFISQVNAVPNVISIDGNRFMAASSTVGVSNDKGHEHPKRSTPIPGPAGFLAKVTPDGGGCASTSTSTGTVNSSNDDRDHGEKKETGVSHGQDDEEPRPETTTRVLRKSQVMFRELLRTKRYKCSFCGKLLGGSRRNKLQHENMHREARKMKKLLEITRRSPPAKTYGRSRKTPLHKMTYGLPPSEKVLVTPKPEPLDHFLDESVDDQQLDDQAFGADVDVAMSMKEESYLQQQGTSAAGDVVRDIKIEDESEENPPCFHYVIKFD